MADADERKKHREDVVNGVSDDKLFYGNREAPSIEGYVLKASAENYTVRDQACHLIN